MDTIAKYAAELVSGYGHWGLMLMAAALVLFVVQMYYYLGRYSRIPSYRNDNGRMKISAAEGISVVVLLGDNSWYLENILPRIMAQDYKTFEVIIVEVGTTEDFSDELIVLKDKYPNLATTRMDYDSRFPISNKMAYNVGIKAATYENIILTTADACPASSKWLSCMAKGFSNGDVVIGYCGFVPKKGSFNAFIRSARFASSVRWLSSAVGGYPYRGIIHNLGFTRRIYFDNRGFDYLNMNLGEDDLFIKRIATRYNTSIILNPHATVRQEQWGGKQWWWQQAKFYISTRRFYSWKAKNPDFNELWSRVLFFAAIVLLIILMPPEIKTGAAVIFLLRAFVVRYKFSKARRRLGEGGIGNMLMFYDLAEPFCLLWLWIMCRLRPAPGVWR